MLNRQGRPTAAGDADAADAATTFTGNRGAATSRRR